MKKTKLLTSLAALALVVSLGACQESSKEGTVDPSDVLDIIRERGAAISSWNGVDASSWTTVNVYPQGTAYDLGDLLGLETEADLNLGSYISYNSIQAVNTETGLKGLHNYVYYDVIDDDKTRLEYLYYDGVDGYVYNNGEITLAEDIAKNYPVSYFTTNLVYLLESEDEDGMLALLSQYVKLGESSSAYTVEGSINKASDGALSVGFYVICNGVSGVSTLGNKYDAFGHITVKVDYDAKGDVSHFYLDASEFANYTGGQGLTLTTQVINYAPFDGDVDAPDWVDDYDSNANTGDSD